jgi:hypothetical protein
MHGDKRPPCACNSLESGKEGWGTLEGRSQSWPRSQNAQRRVNPVVSAIKGWSDPRLWKCPQAGGDGAIDRWRARNYEDEQQSQQEEGDRPTHACKKERLPERKAQHQQAEQLLFGRVPVASGLRHMLSLQAIVRSGRCVRGAQATGRDKQFLLNLALMVILASWNSHSTTPG